jgi:hypothetical protein
MYSSEMKNWKHVLLLHYICRLTSEKEKGYELKREFNTFLKSQSHGMQRVEDKVIYRLK